MALGKNIESLTSGSQKRARDLISVRGGEVSADAARSADRPAAFVHIAPKSMPLPVLIAVPHAGRAYPTALLEQMRDPVLSQLRLEDRYVDKLGVEIARATGTGLLVAHAPRAMLDLNRSEDDVDWDMIAAKRPPTRSRNGNKTLSNARARSGLGLVPRRLPGFGEIWREHLSQNELDRRIAKIHQPYHSFLEQELARIKEAWGAALLVDLHSMPPLRKTGGQDNAPQIVLGDRFGASCHSAVIARAFRYLEGQGCNAAHNRPYSGGYVLDRHAKPQRGVHCVQVEVCRSTYLDAALSQPTAALKPLGAMLAGLVRELGAEVAGFGAARSLPQAAE